MQERPIEGNADSVEESDKLWLLTDQLIKSADRKREETASKPSVGQSGDANKVAEEENKKSK